MDNKRKRFGSFNGLKKGSSSGGLPVNIQDSFTESTIRQFENNSELFSWLLLNVDTNEQALDAIEETLTEMLSYGKEVCRYLEKENPTCKALTTARKRITEYWGEISKVIYNADVEAYHNVKLQQYIRFICSSVNLILNKTKKILGTNNIGEKYKTWLIMQQNFSNYDNDWDDDYEDDDFDWFGTHNYISSRDLFKRLDQEINSERAMEEAKKDSCANRFWFHQKALNAIVKNKYPFEDLICRNLENITYGCGYSEVINNAQAIFRELSDQVITLDENIQEVFNATPRRKLTPEIIAAKKTWDKVYLLWDSEILEGEVYGDAIDKSQEDGADPNMPLPCKPKISPSQFSSMLNSGEMIRICKSLINNNPEVNEKISNRTQEYFCNI